MFIRIAVAAFVVLEILVIAWLLWEIRMDRAQQDRDEWVELTQPIDESIKRWPPKRES